MNVSPAAIPEPQKPLRLFIAIELPGEVRAALKALQRDLPGMRWTPPATCT